jgi:type III secretory pathway component EscT
VVFCCFSIRFWNCSDIVIEKQQNTTMSEQFQNLIENQQNTTMSEQFLNLIENQQNTTMSEQFQNLIENQQNVFLLDFGIVQTLWYFVGFLLVFRIV